MVVVEADGNYLQPFETDDLDIYSGESYSVLLKISQDPSQNYWISFGVRARKPHTPQALTLLRAVPYDVMKPPRNPNTTTGNGVYMLGYDSTVDVILQNANVLAENVSQTTRGISTDMISGC
ncbi:hypothetical protein OIU77_029298 [Salix suchowensis]|uniref:Plastocyanin-like domain-containing protein n=1 Tax=Salix suchowensis TaxID=1278906 RepID=A0ABQ9BM90_9ROSI|nr:hypothetical protein OIU77_029298 [Salix suchowensis]